MTFIVGDRVCLNPIVMGLWPIAKHDMGRRRIERQTPWQKDRIPFPRQREKVNAYCAGRTGLRR